MKKIYLILITGIFLLFSCNRKKEMVDGRYFIYNEASGISSLDPIQAKNQANMWPVHQLFNTLVEVNDELSYMPSIAKYWFCDSLGIRYTFILRNDVYFHDDSSFKNGKGRKLIASDVCYSLARLISPKMASPGSWVLNELVDEEHPFSAPNDSTFVLKLAKPFAPILGVLSMPYCSLIPHEAVDHYGKSFSRHPVGTGPFRFVSWHENQAITLAKNQRYFEMDESGNRLPYLDGVQITFLPAKSAEFIAFRQKKIDFMNDVDPSFKDELINKSGKLHKKWLGKIQLMKSPFLNTEYLGIKMKDTLQGPLMNVHFRKAISHAIDRRKLIFYLRNSIGTSADLGFVPSGLNQFRKKEKVETYNISIAKKHLDSSGYLKSENGKMILLTTVPNYSALGSFIASELSKIGISCKLDVVQKSVLLEQMSAGNVLFFRGSWIADYPDPTNYFGVLYGRNPAPPNYTRFNNEAYDILFEKAEAEINPNGRDSLFNLLEDIIDNEVPLIPLWYDQVVHFYQNSIVNMKPNPLNMLELKRVVKK